MIVIYVLFIISLLFLILYFLAGVLFFKNGGYGSLDFIMVNRYIFYSTALLSIFLSRLFRYINFRFLNKKIEEGSEKAKIFQNANSFFMIFIFITNLISLFWFIVFNFK